MDHILEHESQPVPDLGGVTEQAGGRGAPMDVDDDDEDAQALKSLGALKGNEVEAKVWTPRMQLVCPDACSSPSTTQSIKCSECGKIFKNTALANFHAEKSGHDQFEESTEEVRIEIMQPCWWFQVYDLGQTFDRRREERTARGTATENDCETRDQSCRRSQRAQGQRSPSAQGWQGL